MAPFSDRTPHTARVAERASACRTCPQRGVCFGRIFCTRQEVTTTGPDD